MKAAAKPDSNWICSSSFPMFRKEYTIEVTIFSAKNLRDAVPGPVYTGVTGWATAGFYNTKRRGWDWQQPFFPALEVGSTWVNNYPSGLFWQPGEVELQAPAKAYVDIAWISLYHLYIYISISVVLLSHAGPERMLATPHNGSIHTHIYIYIYMYTYTQTHTHTYIYIYI